VSSMARRRPGLKMNLSNLQPFEPPQQAHQYDLLGAPLIGCLPTPSPTTLNFNITPRPGLASRFSDESSSSSGSEKWQPISSIPMAKPQFASPLLSTNTPITPRTVDALDCFGISSSVSSVLMRRNNSRDSKQSALAPKSPDQFRSLPRSPLAMPISSANMHSSPLIRARSSSSGTTMMSITERFSPIDKKNFESELLATPEELNVPFQWVCEDDTDNYKPINPYFPVNASA